MADVFDKLKVQKNQTVKTYEVQDSSLRALVSNKTMGTSAGTVTGAIAEHESDISSLNSDIAKLQEGLAIIVTGDTAPVAVPVGGYAYLKTNTHGLADGLYKNTSSSAFPVSGGTADSTVFTAVPTGAVNDAVSALTNKEQITATAASGVTIQIFAFSKKCGSYAYIVFVLDITSDKVIYDKLLDLNVTAEGPMYFPVFHGSTFAPLNVGCYITGNAVYTMGALASGTRIMGSTIILVNDQ